MQGIVERRLKGKLLLRASTSWTTDRFLASGSYPTATTNRSKFGTDRSSLSLYVLFSFLFFLTHLSSTFSSIFSFFFFSFTFSYPLKPFSPGFINSYCSPSLSLCLFFTLSHALKQFNVYTVMPFKVNEGTQCYRGCLCVAERWTRRSGEEKGDC